MLSRAPSSPVNCSRATRTSTHLWGFQSHHHCRAPVFTHTDCGTGPKSTGQSHREAGGAPDSGPMRTQLPNFPLVTKVELTLNRPLSRRCLCTPS